MTIMEKNYGNGWKVIYPEDTIPEPVIPSENFVQTIAANIDNQKVSDSEFREFIRNTLPIVIYERG